MPPIYNPLAKSQSEGEPKSMTDQPDHTGLGLADPSQPAASAFGLGLAALSMTIFGFVWLGWGFSVCAAFTDFSSGSALPATRWITFYVAFLVLLVTSIWAQRQAKARLQALSTTPGDFRAKFGKPFRLIVYLEGTACAIVVSMVLIFHRRDLLAAGISLVVGLHFLPLARLFRFPSYYAAGIVIILCDLLSIATLRADSITLSVGIETGAVLWATAIYALLLSRHFLGKAAH
jgi:hypothetical protein